MEGGWKEMESKKGRVGVGIFFFFLFFFFNDTATTEIYTLSLHDALPICYSPVYCYPVVSKMLHVTLTITSYTLHDSKHRPGVIGRAHV